MDDIVAQAMQKWPNVPDVYGWLSLDRRGNWLLKGERIGNAALNAFIGRNYACDQRGRWFFQNGPQRVFVALAAAPYIYSLHLAANLITVTTHTGAVAQRVDAVLLDSGGSLMLATDLGPGLVHDRDLAIALDGVKDANGIPATEDGIAALQRGELRELWIDFGSEKLMLQTIDAGELAARFGFDPDPKPVSERVADNPSL